MPRNGLSVEIENTGKYAGDEVVQLYIKHVAASVTRRSGSFGAFQRITLRPGEKRRVKFTLGPEATRLLQSGNAFRRRTGERERFVGTSFGGRAGVGL